HVLVQVGDRCVGGDLRCGGVGRRTCVEGRGRGQYACAVHVLDETLDVVVGGLVEDLLGGADLCDPPVPEHADPIAQAHGLVEVVRDEHDRLAQPLLQFQELCLHVTTDQRVQGTERLVHQDDVGVRRQRPGQSHTLLHTTGELLGKLLLPTFQ